MLIQEPKAVPKPGPADDSWPSEVGLILSALEAGGRSFEDRRTRRRIPYRTRAVLRLFSDASGAVPKVLYTRDVNARSLGFLTPHRLPLGYGGTVEMIDPTGKIISAHCTLLRCREAAPGWFDGALYFNREQWAFEDEADDESEEPLEQA